MRRRDGLFTAFTNAIQAANLPLSQALMTVQSSQGDTASHLDAAIARLRTLKQSAAQHGASSKAVRRWHAPRKRGDLRVDRPHVVPGSNSESSESQEEWLRLHAADLIRRLQSWSVDLDSREAKLDAAVSRLKIRERQFRLQQQKFESQLLSQQAVADALAQRLIRYVERIG